MLLLVSRPGIQTENRSTQQQQEEWRAAMERSRRMLTSQERAMEEYLRRQRKEAERHIRNSPLAIRKHSHGILSMPGTPTGSRRSAGGGDFVDGDGYPVRVSRGGSLERQSPARFPLQARQLFWATLRTFD